MPGARRARGLACKIKQSTRASSPRSRRKSPGIPRAMVLRFIPCSPRRANSSCRRRPWIKRRLAARSGCEEPPRTWHQQRVSGPHGFTVRARLRQRLRPAFKPVSRSLGEGGSAPSVSAPEFAHGVHPALRLRSRARRCRVHRIPRPTSVTIAKRPSEGAGRRGI